MKAIERTLINVADTFGLEISAVSVEMFVRYAAELIKWNKKINLTSIVREEEIAIKHFVDSLSPLKFIEINGLVLDIGSGGGFPSIPLKIYGVDSEIISIDAVEKKINFQRHIARVLGLEGFSAIHGRVESLNETVPEKFSIIISRAFSSLPDFVRVSLPLLEKNGTIVAMKGREGKAEVAAAKSDLEESGVEVIALEEFSLPVTGDPRSIILLKKI